MAVNAGEGIGELLGLQGGGFEKLLGVQFDRTHARAFNPAAGAGTLARI